MAHVEQKQYVLDLATKMPQYFNNVKVLEVGSLNINGTIRVNFKDCNYLGIDVGPGPQVDLVCQGQDLDHADGSYDTVCSCECFEHNPYWKETFLNMVRMCKSNGLVFFTCATTGRPEHGTRRTDPNASPLTLNLWDYYQNLAEEDFRSNFDFDALFQHYEFSGSTKSLDLYFYGIKK